jgi:hypothetical protein
VEHVGRAHTSHLTPTIIARPRNEGAHVFVQFTTGNTLRHGASCTMGVTLPEYVAVGITSAVVCSADSAASLANCCTASASVVTTSFVRGLGSGELVLPLRHRLRELLEPAACRQLE